MDIKLKNNHKTRNRLTVAGLLLLTVLTICFFPMINQSAQAELARWSETAEQSSEVNTELLRKIYNGCYVLYLETAQRQGTYTAADVYLTASHAGNSDEIKELLGELMSWTNGTLEHMESEFEIYRSAIDYCVILEDGVYEKNTSQELESAFTEPKNTEKVRLLQEYYNNYFVLKFDQNGILTIDLLYSANADTDTLIKTIGQIDRENEIWGRTGKEYQELGLDCQLGKPSGFTVVFGIPKTSDYQLIVDYYSPYEYGADYWRIMNAYSCAGAQSLYAVMLVLIAAMVFLLNSGKVWKTDIPMKRPGNWYLMEAAVIGVICVLLMTDSFIQMIWSYDFTLSYSELWESLTGGGALSVLADLFIMALAIFLIYGVWYLSLRFIRPVFTLGLREYIRQYSFFYQIFPWLKKKWNGFCQEIGHIDFSEKSTKTILKIVVLNFAVLAVCSMMWFFGIFALLVYSVILFFLIKKYYDKAGRDYRTLLRGVNQIAEGNLEAEITGDIGMFEPFREELARIRIGFKKAVDEEVKSQRMKTELITNVSHDLKTPLTAITTYVELLKKEDITEEERRSYIDTLEKKSLRLKVLIEDLFEVSKATSNNIILNRMEVDVVNLMKQVSVEHTEQFMAAGLDLRWRIPEGKAVLMLDNQKTYRIFENLFVNIQKYAMPGSRVYVDVKRMQDGKKEECVEITIKNMSAEELNFKADEITERFVRGDASRNTEGFGLGLAIAKSFTEAQDGSFHVEVDGDLFKVVIRWKCGKLQVDGEQ